MKKLYNSPDAELSMLPKEDICLSSGGSASGNNGDTANISVDFMDAFDISI